MIQFKSEGMNCGSCIRAITEAVHELDPQARVTVDLSEQLISIESPLDSDILAKRIQEEGYPVLATKKVG